MGVRVRQRDGAWWVFVNHQGRRKARRIGEGEPGRKAAKKAAEQIAAKLALGEVGFLETPMRGPVPTFEQVAADWERVVAPTLKKGSQITYSGALRHRILPVFGQLPITEVTPERVEAWWTGTREEKLSKRYLGILRSIVREVCRRALRLRLIKANPTEWIEGKLGREDTEIRKVDYLTAEDLTRFLAVAERVAPAEHPIFAVMATGGLRIGEAIALQVGDLDTAGQRVHVRRMVRRAYISSPKMGKARVVDLPATTVALLARVREIRQAEAAVRGVEPRWFFPGQWDTMPVTPEKVQQVFPKVLRAAGLRKLRPHDLRHTYATLAIQAGVPLLTVSRQLGHASINTTVDLYAHAVPGSNRAAAEALESILTGNQTQPPRNPTP